MYFDIEQYRSQGFTIFENFLTNKELETFESGIQRFSEQQMLQKGMVQRKSEPLIDLFEIGGNYRKYLYDMLQDSLTLVHLKFKLVSFLENQGVLEKLGFIMPRVINGIIITLPGESQHDNPIHQDVFNRLSHRGIRFWIPLRKVDSTCGSMRIWAGSHVHGFIPHNDDTNSTYPKIQKEECASFDEKLLEMEPGPVVMFDPMLVHESVKNVSDKIKFVASIDIQDIGALPDFDDPEDDIIKMQKVTKQRKAAREKFHL